MGPRCLYSTGYLNKLMILLAHHEMNVLYHQLIVICRWCGNSFWKIWNHDDVIKWKCFLRYWPFVRGIHRSPVNSPHKHHWRGPLMFSLICAWINRWVNNREAGDLRHHCAHYDVIVMNDAHVLRRVTRPALGTVVEWKRQCMMTSSNGNIFRANGHLCKGPVTRGFDVFFDLRLNKRLSKQSWGWWFETLSRPFGRHRDGIPNL